MTILGAAIRSLEDTNVPITTYTPEVGELFGVADSASGVPVTERSVYGLTAWYRAIALLAGAIAALPIKVYRNGTRELVTITNPVTTPSTTVTPFEFWQTTLANAAGWGNAYARKLRNNAGVVRELVTIHPALVHVQAVPASELYPDGKRFAVRNPLTGTVEYLSSWHILHLPYLAPDGTLGVSPIRAAATTLGTGLAADQSSASLFRNGSRLAGVLQTEQELNDKQAEERRKRWRQRTSGPQNAGDVAVLDKNLTFKAIALNPQEAELLNSRKWTVTEVARLFGIPPHLLGDVEKSTSWGSGIEQQMIGFVQFTLLPWLKLIEQRLTFDVLPGGFTRGTWYAEYSVEGLLRGDSAARAAFYHSGIVDGWLNRNEARAKENLEPVDGLDEFLVPSNLTLISVDGQLVPLAGQGTPVPEPAPA